MYKSAITLASLMLFMSWATAQSISPGTRAELAPTGGKSGRTQFPVREWHGEKEEID